MSKPKVKAFYNYSYNYEGKKIRFKRGDEFQLLTKSNVDWWLVRRYIDGSAQDIYVPAAYVKEVNNFPRNFNTPNLTYMNLDKRVDREDALYSNAYHHFISTKDVLEMLFLKFLFGGQPRQGKTTARRRLMGEIVDLESAGEAEKPQASTGVVESGHDMIVQSLTDTTAVITDKKWSVVNSLTDEASLLFHNFLDIIQSKNRPVQDVEKPKHVPEMADIIKEISQKPDFWKDVKQSFRAYLRMEDTGGQPEMMDMLPALTIGPGLYLLFFSYECDLKSNFQVYYETSSGKTTKHEQSVVTLEEMLLSILSSISCSNSLCSSMGLAKSNDSDMQDILSSSKSVAYIVGTHRDKVSDGYVAEFDEKLQKVIRDTHFFEKGVVQFFSENELIISMNNLTGGKEEVSQIREVLERAMERHFKKLKIPAVWLLFSLCLRMRGIRTASLGTCLELSTAFNMTPSETQVALWFLHHHAGVFMYFPNVSGLEDLVIIDIQVVYDSITSVILKAMSFDYVGQATAEKFRSTGQFSLKDLDATTSNISGDLIPSLKLVALLEYLHIVARIISACSSTASSEDGNEVYMMPCVLRNATKASLDAISSDQSRPSHVAPLRMRYECGFVPIGVFPALTASFIGNSSFVLKEEGVMKNLVQFHYGFDYALVSFLAHPKSYEIVISQLPKGNGEPHIICVDLRKEIETTIEKVSSRMNYGCFMDYQFGFACSTHPDEEHVCVVNRASSSPQAMLCLRNLKNKVPKDMLSCHKVWYGEPLKQAKGSNSQAAASLLPHSDLTCASIMRLFHGEVPFSRAQDLGVYLEIKPAIVIDLISDKKDSQGKMAAVVSYWLEYDKDCSWKKLAEAVEYCGYKVVAEKIRSEHVVDVTS